MKHKIKENLANPAAGVLLNNFTGESFQTNEPMVILVEKNRHTHCKSYLEEFILSEFDIDGETMEEHFQELLVYMMQNQLIDKKPQD